MCNINDPRILNAYIAITEEEPTDWLILGYRDTRDVISLYASGVHGLSEFRDNLTNEILFGFVRVEDKFILITYVPDSVSGVRRARALVHSRAVAGILELSHAQFTASSLSDLSDTNVRTRLKLGQNQVPNRPRSVSKRASFVVQQRRRRSGTYSPAMSSSPSPISERNLKIHLNTTEEPYSYYEDSSDRMTATPTPSTPTSVASSSYNNNESPYFAVEADNNNSFSNVVDEQERKKLQDHTEAMLQFQLSKKKELEEARFRQFQRDQQEERFKREQDIKRIEEEKKRQSLVQQQKATKQKELPKWQQELIQRKLKRQQDQQALKDQQPLPSPHPNTVELKPVQQNEKVLKPSQQLQKPVLSKIQIPERSASPVPQTPLQMVQLKSAKPSLPEPTQHNRRESVLLKQRSIQDLEIKKQPEELTFPVINNADVATPAEPLVVAVAPDVKVPSVTATVTTMMTGFISVQTNVSPFWKRRYFVINNQSLLLYKDEMSKNAMSTVNYVDAKRISPADEDEDTFVPNSYMIYTKTGDSYQLLADDKKLGKQIYATLKQLISSA